MTQAPNADFTIHVSFVFFVNSLFASPMTAMITSLELLNDSRIIVPLWFQVICSRKTGLAPGLGYDLDTSANTGNKHDDSWEAKEKRTN